MSDKEYEKEGLSEWSRIGYLKKTKSSTQFLEGPHPSDERIAVMASAILPKMPPELAAPKGVLWSM